MERAEVNGVELEYEIRGTGDPVLLIHGSHICGSFVPLLGQHTLTDDYALIRYHRRGFRDSSPARDKVSVADQAADAAALLEHLRVGPAHVVGHSYGGPIALQLALDTPQAVHSLALLEAAILSVPGGDKVRELVAAASKLYYDGEWEAAEDLFLGSPKERADITRNVPGGLEQALRDVDTYFLVEAPAHDEWSFDATEGARIGCPVLFMNGAESSQLYREVRDQVTEWMPQTESAVLSGASHLLHIQQPAGAAELLADFFGAHPAQESVRGQVGGPRRPRQRRDPDRYNACVDILDRNLERGRADKVAIRTPQGDWSYRQLSAAANRAGNALAELGVEIENRVLMVVDDSSEFAATFFGAIKIGAVPVPVNTNLTADEYAFLLDDSRAKVAVVSESVADVLRGVRKRARHLRHLVVIGQAGPGESRFADITRSASAELTTAATTRDDVGFWLYTSGTGGRPKAVVHSQHAMRSASDTYARIVLGLDESDTTFSVSKLYFAYGLGNGLYFPLAAGATTVLSAEPPQPRMVLHMLREFRPTVLFSVPSSYATLLDAGPSRKGDEFDSVRVCVSAGEPLAPALLRRWEEEIGQPIVEGLGSTESCHIVVSNRIGEVRPGSTGLPVDGYQVRVVDESGADAAPGEPGMLQVKGDSTFLGYWRGRAATRAALLGDWLATGDVYIADADGYLSFQGRLDDMLKVSGMWVSPIEVEGTLVEQDQVSDCAVVGVHDAINLVRLVAFVVPAAGSDTDGLANVLRQRVRQRLGGNKTPRAFHFVDELPRTATGKVQRAALREQASAVVSES